MIATHDKFSGNAHNTFRLPPTLLSHNPSLTHTKLSLGLRNLQL